MGEVGLRWNVMIPMRDGVRLSATLYLPDPQEVPAPVIFTMTPYIAQTYHEYGTWFAARGYPFLCVDVSWNGSHASPIAPAR
jgi:uncharacterized protein